MSGQPAWVRTLPLLSRTLAVGAGGGALFAWLGTPLPWMLGALIFTSVGAMAGIRMYTPPEFRRVMMAVLGVLLGSAFSPDLTGQIAAWPATLAGMLLYVAVGGGLTMLFFHRVGRLNGPTAFFAAAPGGLSEMMLLGPAMGGNEREITLVHATRIVLVVLILPPAFRYAAGYVPPADLGSGGTIAAMEVYDLAILTAAGVVGLLVGRRLRFPAYQMTGPMLLSAALHVGGLTEARPPYELLAVAQVIIGCGAGARFSGVRWIELARPMLLSIVSTTGFLLLAALFALLLARLIGLDFKAILLAYSPGGFAEMNLIALSLGIEVAFVATHHTARIFLVVTLAAWLSSRIWKRPQAAAHAD